jgi:hypothetical protein
MAVAKNTNEPLENSICIPCMWSLRTFFQKISKLETKTKPLDVYRRWNHLKILYSLSLGPPKNVNLCAEWHFLYPEYAQNGTFHILSMRQITLSVPWVCAEWSLAQCWVCAELWKRSHRWQNGFFLETFNKTKDEIYNIWDKICLMYLYLLCKWISLHEFSYVTWVPHTVL